ncbi:conserved hypothetical protein [Alkaliphilus metalliredigens QYMF]|uniref:ATP-grasp domain-containing protein n=1 Tax=Alkaliphilus metalliredigens (strain QYMF) TaxID=293826 RepID=A6TTN2_ALKMQ|nr:ATP-grasp domain-containing protein [Alkaliphilus metalliredigens]ABR49550.1 conserved hypothetical protein [Alkaliphilus metalliredigens QYMF]
MNPYNTVLLPIVSLSDIFGKDLILNPRASFSNYGWLPKNREKLDFLTGAPLTVAGDMPVICSDSVVSQEIISLLKRVNLEVAPFRHIYHSERSYQDTLDLFNGQKKQMVVNHPHPSSEINRGGYWIDPQLIGFLNNKANLEKLVPIGHTPRRVVIHPNEISKTVDQLKKLPVVIKVASDEPNGGGYDVVICKSKKDVSYAYNYFNTCSTVVVEEYIEIEQSYNIQFAKTIKGDIIYLGTSEQIATADGIYIGNWFERDHEPPEKLMKVGLAIMEYACSLGFIGIGGFDIVISNDNRQFVIDLNFRLNGSTAPLLLKESIFSAYNASILLFQNWDSHLKWDDFFAVCQQAVEELNFIPLAFNNPLSNSNPDTACYVSGVIFGSSKEEILEKEECLNVCMTNVM